MIRSYVILPLFACFFWLGSSQYSKGSTQCKHVSFISFFSDPILNLTLHSFFIVYLLHPDKRTYEENAETLLGQIQSNPDVNLLFYPEREYISSDSYVYEYPESANYRLGLLIDPCRYNAYNCCMNVFGSPEYPKLLISGVDQNRVFK
jgi:hypothetical protein